MVASAVSSMVALTFQELLEDLGQNPRRIPMLFGHGYTPVLSQAEPYEQLNHGLHEGKLFYVRSLGQCPLLDTSVTTDYTGILHLYSVIQPPILQHGEYVQGQPSVGEQLGKSPHVCKITTP